MSIDWKKFWRKVPHSHSWINPHEVCCEGKNFKKRVCSYCGYEQWVSRYGWEDSPRERARKMKLR